MDESLQELENELARLRPRKPSARLLASLARELSAPAAITPAMENSHARKLIVGPWMNWRMAAAAAAVVAFGTVLFTTRIARSPERTSSVPEVIASTVVPVIAPVATTSTPAPEVIPGNSTPVSDRYRPVGAATVLYDLKEDGPVTLANSTPARRVRYRYVDTYTWKNPATKASLKWSLPRDEVRVIPASLH